MPTPLVEQSLEGPLGKIQVFRAGPGAEGRGPSAPEEMPLAASTNGAGPPLVYLHSAGGEAQGVGVLEDLADDFDVIAPIFPGFGESEGIDDIDSMEDAVFHLLDVWELLDLDAPTVLGLSLGGWMAIELATRYPEKVGALVAVNPVGLHLDDAPIAEMFGRPPSELAEMLFVDQEHPIAQMMHAMAEFAGDVGKQVEIPLELVLPMVKSLAATAKIGWDPYLHNPKLRGRLRRITAPTLVVAGAQDGLVPLAHAETYAAEIPGAKLEVLDDAAHWLPLEKPEALARLVRSATAP